jgi:hypothetical protein
MTAPESTAIAAWSSPAISATSTRPAGMRLESSDARRARVASSLAWAGRMTTAEEGIVFDMVLLKRGREGKREYRLTDKVHQYK